MSRISIAALILAFSAFVVGVAGPALDQTVLREQLSFAQRATDHPKQAAPPEQTGLRAEASRWLARKIRERNDGEGARGAPLENEGLFGALARYVVPLQFLLALAALGLALVDWLRTRALRANLTAGVVAGAAIVLPFAWSAVAIAITIGACLIALAIVGSVLG